MVIDIKIIYSLLIAKYKPSYSYSLPSSNAGSYMFSAINPICRYRCLRRSRDPLPLYTDLANLWHLYAGHLGPEALEKLV